jgi:hypothetical protein
VWQGVASLRKSLALTAGHGLMQLWEAMLTVEHVIDEASLSALDIDIARLVPGEKRIGETYLVPIHASSDSNIVELRRQSLQLMSLKAIPQKSNHDRGAIIALFEQVKAVCRLSFGCTFIQLLMLSQTIDDQKKKQPDESVVHPIILLAELETLSHLTPQMGNTMVGVSLMLRFLPKRIIALHTTSSNHYRYRLPRHIYIFESILCIPTSSMGNRSFQRCGLFP